jgi:phosphoribosylformylglycinamidine synthase
VLLVGPPGAELGCSEYLAHRLGRTDDLGPPPSLDLDVERAVQTFVREAARRGLLRSAHDCSEGGLAVAIAECCIAGDIGFAFNGYDEDEGPPRPERLDAALFGEGQSRIVLSCRPTNSPALFTLLRELGISGALSVLGVVGGDILSWSDDLSVSVKELARAWNTPF